MNPSGTLNWSGVPGPAIPVTNQCFVGDFDGDGKADLACYTGNAGIWNVALSTGIGWQSEFWNGGPSPVVFPVSADCFVGDFNGDRKSDIACYTDNGSSWDVALSTGSGWNNATWSGGPQPIVPIETQCFAGDLNGDHKNNAGVSLSGCDSGAATRMRKDLEDARRISDQLDSETYPPRLSAVVDYLKRQLRLQLWLGEQEIRFAETGALPQSDLNGTPACHVTAKLASRERANGGCSAIGGWICILKSSASRLGLYPKTQFKAFLNSRGIQILKWEGIGD